MSGPRKPEQMVVAKASRFVAFGCGCMAELQFVGTHAGLKDGEGKRDWHVTPCYYHARDRVAGQLEKTAEEAWKMSVPIDCPRV